jgi:hypothetical protein
MEKKQKTKQVLTRILRVEGGACTENLDSMTIEVAFNIHEVPHISTENSRIEHNKDLNMSDAIEIFGWDAVSEELASLKRRIMYRLCPTLKMAEIKVAEMEFIEKIRSHYDPIHGKEIEPNHKSNVSFKKTTPKEKELKKRTAKQIASLKAFKLEKKDKEKIKKEKAREQVKKFRAKPPKP